jgi:hypothetical protein
VEKGVYEEFVIRDQDRDAVQTLDLLQGWGRQGQEPLRVRLGRALVSVGRSLTGEKADPTSGLMPSSMCGLR